MMPDSSSHQLIQSISEDLFLRLFIMYMRMPSLLANGEIKDGEKINVVVPTGNFGNILSCILR